MDPAGLSMEHFDAIGRWRARGEDGAALDVVGICLADRRSRVSRASGRRWSRDPDVFVSTLSESC